MNNPRQLTWVGTVIAEWRDYGELWVMGGLWSEGQREALKEFMSAGIPKSKYKIEMVFDEEPTQIIAYFANRPYKCMSPGNGSIKVEEVWK